MLNRFLEYNSSAVGIFFFVALLKVLLYIAGINDTVLYEASLFRLFQPDTLWSGILAALSSVLLGVLILFNSENHAKRTDFSYWLVLFFVLQLNFYGFYGFTVEYLGLFAFVLSHYFFSQGLADVDKKRSIVDCFNLAFTLGVGTMFTPHLLFVVPLFWISRMAIGMASGRSFFVSVLAFALPFVIADTFIFAFFSDRAQFTHLYLWEQLQHGSHLNLFKYIRWEQLSNVGPFLMLVISLYATFSKANTYKTVVRKFNTINLIALVYIVLANSLSLLPSHLGMMLLMVPTSYFFSNFQSDASPRARSLFLSALLVSGLLSYPPLMNSIISLIEMLF